MEGLQPRKLHRLKGYDYGQNGYYFVTICTSCRNPILSDIVGNDALIVPSPVGEIVIKCWNNIEKLNANVKTDKFILMPNHIHGIIILENTDSCEKTKGKYGFEISERRERRSLQGLMKDFKSVTTRHYKKIMNKTTSLWQESYYDEIVRNDIQYLNLWRYIDENPLRWKDDEYYS